MREFTPTLHVSERDGRVRLRLDQCTSAEGATLQDAADELVRQVLLLAMTLRAEGIRYSSTSLRPDPDVISFLWRLGEAAASGANIRQLLF
jgi:hypothetical protein